MSSRTNSKDSRYDIHRAYMKAVDKMLHGKTTPHTANEICNEKHPWHHAHQDKRTYITPKDIQAAIEADGEKEEVWLDVLQGVESGSLEDASACAFVAIRFEKQQHCEVHEQYDQGCTACIDENYPINNNRTNWRMGR